MECQSSDSKKLFKIFDTSKRKRSRKKREGHDDTLSIGTDESISICHANARVASQKASLQELSTAQLGTRDVVSKRGSSPSITRSRRPSRSPRRYRERRTTREGASLALKAGLISTPRSSSPRLGQDGADDTIPNEDSFIYAFLEDAIKRDKKKQRSARKREGREEREESPRDRHRHHHRHRDEVPSRDRERDKRSSREQTEQRPKVIEPVVSPVVDQTALIETFAKMCAQLNNKSSYNANQTTNVSRTQSHKSLQCSVVASRRDSYDVDQDPVRLRSNSQARDAIVSRTRLDKPSRVNSRDKLDDRRRHDKCMCYYQRDDVKYQSKMEFDRSLREEEERYRDYPPDTVPTKTCIDPYRRPENREYRDYERERMRQYEEERRKYCGQTTSRSFEVNRDAYERYRRPSRSEIMNKRPMDRYEQKFYDKNVSRVSNVPSRIKKMDRLERTSEVSREDEYKERDRYSERERDSGLSVADGETSTVSGRSNCLKAVKQEIIEQREAMDKMMKLWKELMRCFKGITQNEGQDKNVQDSAANARDSAAAQLRLWRECMHRYETVARDVGDTDARLMEEIKKQRSEMAEMANMWQECLQRYRDISNDFNNLKQQVPKLAPVEVPTRPVGCPMPGALPGTLPGTLPGAPLLCAEGEGAPPMPYHHMSSHYPQMGGAYGYGESPSRGRAAPWLWSRSPAPRSPHAPRSPRRRSSPDSHGSRERRRRHKDRDEARYKEKSKPSAARSEHKHRKR